MPSPATRQELLIKPDFFIIDDIDPDWVPRKRDDRLMQQWFATEIRSRLKPQPIRANDIYSTLTTDFDYFKRYYYQEVPMSRQEPGGTIRISRRQDRTTQSWIYETTFTVTQDISRYALEGKDAGKVEEMYVERMLREAAGMTARAKLENVVIVEGAGVNQTQRRVGKDLSCECCGQLKRGVRRF